MPGGNGPLAIGKKSAPRTALSRSWSVANANALRTLMSAIGLVCPPTSGSELIRK